MPIQRVHMAHDKLVAALSSWLLDMATEPAKPDLGAVLSARIRGSAVGRLLDEETIDDLAQALCIACHDAAS